MEKKNINDDEDFRRTTMAINPSSLHLWTNLCVATGKATSFRTIGPQVLFVCDSGRRGYQHQKARSWEGIQVFKGCNDTLLNFHIPTKKR